MHNHHKPGQGGSAFCDSQPAKGIICTAFGRDLVKHHECGYWKLNPEGAPRFAIDINQEFLILRKNSGLSPCMNRRHLKDVHHEVKQSVNPSACCAAESSCLPVILSFPLQNFTWLLGAEPSLSNATIHQLRKPSARLPLASS